MFMAAQTPKTVDVLVPFKEKWEPPLSKLHHETALPLASIPLIVV